MSWYRGGGLLICFQLCVTKLKGRIILPELCNFCTLLTQKIESNNSPNDLLLGLFSNWIFNSIGIKVNYTSSYLLFKTVWFLKFQMTSAYSTELRYNKHCIIMSSKKSSAPKEWNSLKVLVTDTLTKDTNCLLIRLKVGSLVTILISHSTI